LEAVFLTNDFDDPLEGFSTRRYVPCLRTDDLVFHLAKPQVRSRLAKATGIDPCGIQEVGEGIGRLFEHFVGKGARACAISLPPDFAPVAVSHASAAAAWDRVIRSADQGVAFEDLDPNGCRTLAYWVFWTLAEHCERHRLPFDLMIGVNRRVYPGGVYQGQDLFDSRVSMIQYAALLNRFSKVQFPISVLASVTNQELVDYAWIFPNVVTHGHWWYSNTPSWIARDLAARLEAIPANKQIGYYSDMYKLEFALPKFAMYKRLLARQLAEQFVMDRRWPEERAVALGHQVLRGNVESVFYGER
jgi:glucuronate isomerase